MDNSSEKYKNRTQKFECATGVQFINRKLNLKATPMFFPKMDESSALELARSKSGLSRFDSWQPVVL